MTWLWIVLGIVALLFLLLAAASLYFFSFSIVRAKNERPEESYGEDANPTWGKYAEGVRNGQKWLKEHVTDEVTITSYDGLKLTALYVPSAAEEPRGTCIVFHGYRSLATVDFAPEVEFLHSLGYRLLVPYQRSHGKSEGRYITYGVKERFDCRDWADYIDGRFPGEDIYLMGISMGCATVLMSAGTKLPKTVRGIVGDCGFTSPWEIMKSVAKNDHHLPAFPLLYTVDFLAKRLANFSLKEADTREAMEKTRLPVLFIHGDGDTFVPFSMTKENYEAYGVVSGSREKELYVVPGAGHALAYLADTEGCQKKIAEFLEKHHS